MTVARPKTRFPSVRDRLLMDRYDLTEAEAYDFKNCRQKGFTISESLGIIHRSRPSKTAVQP